MQKAEHSLQIMIVLSISMCLASVGVQCTTVYEQRIIKGARSTQFSQKQTRSPRSIHGVVVKEI